MRLSSFFAALICILEVFFPSVCLAAPEPQPVPVSVRGMAPHFERTLQVCLMQGEEWLLPYQSPTEAATAMAVYTPTFITGAYWLEAGKKISRETVERWLDIRELMQQANSVVGFDLVMDLRGYATAGAAVKQMEDAAALLPAEAWTFIGIVEAEMKVPGILAAAIAQAHSQGRKAGAVLNGKSPAPGLDYVVIPYGGGKTFSRRAGEARAVSAKRTAPVVIWNGSEKVRPGESFAMGKTPAQRRMLVMAAAAKQKQGVFYAYPLFGPKADAGRSYDALRDEFMVDTLWRCIKAHNPVAPPLPLEPF